MDQQATVLRSPAERIKHFRAAAAWHMPKHPRTLKLIDTIVWSIVRKPGSTLGTIHAIEFVRFVKYVVDLYGLADATENSVATWATTYAMVKGRADISIESFFLKRPRVEIECDVLRKELVGWLFEVGTATADIRRFLYAFRYVWHNMVSDTDIERVTVMRMALERAEKSERSERRLALEVDDD